eukprot:1368581-Amphidinium_carterae.1
MGSAASPLAHSQCLVMLLCHRSALDNSALPAPPHAWQYASTACHGQPRTRTTTRGSNARSQT